MTFTQKAGAIGQFIKDNKDLVKDFRDTMPEKTHDIFCNQIPVYEWIDSMPVYHWRTIFHKDELYLIQLVIFNPFTKLEAM